MTTGTRNGLRPSAKSAAPSLGPFTSTSQTVRQALQELPIEFREVVALREMEDLSYKEIASVGRVGS